MSSITFDKSVKDFILDAFGKTTDSEGYVVEKNNLTQRVLTPDGEEIKKDEFAVIKKGSEKYIKSDLISLIRLSDELGG
ncbi:hypothetical protein HYV21_00265 [Candidatus Microgenomates bacterium]|nr:hypothetical protein [Candidatus Microgenomates bacterium]